MYDHTFRDTNFRWLLTMRQTLVERTKKMGLFLFLAGDDTCDMTIDKNILK